jgi:hypothetical protein
MTYLPISRNLPVSSKVISGGQTGRLVISQASLSFFKDKRLK